MDINLLARKIIDRGWYGRLTGRSRKQILRKLGAINTVLAQAITTELARRLTEEYATVPPPENAGVNIAAGCHVNAPGQDDPVKVESLDGEIVYCAIPGTGSSIPFPRRLLERVEVPSQSAQNGQAGGRPPGAIISDIADAYLGQNIVSQEGLCLIRYWSGHWYKWNGQYYAGLMEEEVEGLVMTFLRDHSLYRGQATRKTVLDVVAHLKAPSVGGLPSSITSPTWISPDGTVRQASNIIALKNGFLDINKLADLKKSCGDWAPARIELTPKLFVTYGLPFVFDPTAQCPMFMKFLEQIQPNPEIRRQIKLLFGLSLIPETRFNVFFIFFGEAGTGKSVLLDCLIAVIGPQNVNAVPFHQFVDKFAIGDLTRHLLNIVSDNDTDTPKDTGFAQIEGIIKIVTDGGDLRTEEKFKAAYRAKATARLILATNTLPPFLDRSKGIWDRLRVVPFDVRFRETAQEDTFLRQKIINAELPGILNWALEGLIELQALQRFPETEEGRARKTDHRLTCDHEAEYLTDLFAASADPKHVFPSGNFYQLYREWCIQNGYHPFGASRFAKSVQRVFPNVRKVFTADTGPSGKCRAWQGIRYRLSTDPDETGPVKQEGTGTTGISISQ